MSRTFGGGGGGDDEMIVSWSRFPKDSRKSLPCIDRSITATLIAPLPGLKSKREKSCFALYSMHVRCVLCPTVLLLCRARKQCREFT